VEIVVSAGRAAHQTDRAGCSLPAANSLLAKQMGLIRWPALPVEDEGDESRGSSSPDIRARVLMVGQTYDGSVEAAIVEALLERVVLKTAQKLYTLAGRSESSILLRLPAGAPARCN
jgi:hypothetical protein